jgi:ethylene-insensitive protein 2
MSKSIMCAHKISQSLEILALTIFLGMLSLNIIFLVEMIFGNSDWVGDLRWNVGNGVSISYSVLLITGFVSICLMLRLATIPLRYSNIQLNAKVLNRDMPEAIPNSLVDGEKSHVIETVGYEDASFQVDEPKPALTRSLEYPKVSLASFHPNIPETVIEPDP